MGCVTSKHRMNDHHTNIFNVMNVNDSGQVISPGQLEVTDTELVLHQKGKLPTRWPLSFLRKYGCDSELFTFECGRRCPTGQGIYAFRCRKAEQLFNLLQQNLNISNNTVGASLMNPNGTINEYPVPAASTGPPVHRRVSGQPEGYLNPTNNSVVVRPHPTLSRPGSMNSSNGPVSPSTISPPPSANDISFEHNNNKRGSLIPEHSYTNASVIADSDNTVVSYKNLSAVSSPTLPGENYVNLPEANSPLYMNVNTTESGLVTPSLAKDIQMPNLETDLHDRPVGRQEGVQERPVGGQDRPLGVLDRAIGSQDRPIGVQDRMISFQDRLLSIQDRSMSIQDRSMSIQDRSMSIQDRAMSLQDRAIQERTIHDRSIGLQDRPLGLQDRPIGLQDRSIGESEVDDRHCYANIGPIEEIEIQRPIFSTNLDSVPPTPTSNPPREINYVQLDLESSSTNSRSKSNAQQKPDSPSTAKKSYVTIDFLKSNALSQVTSGKHRSSLSD